MTAPTSIDVDGVMAQVRAQFEIGDEQINETLRVFMFELVSDGLPLGATLLDSLRDAHSQRAVLVTRLTHLALTAEKALADSEAATALARGAIARLKSQV